MTGALDAIESPNLQHEIFRTIPESGASGQFAFGGQLVVHGGQVAVFYHNGFVCDVFRPGRHTLSIDNMPKLKERAGASVDGMSHFTARVYFVFTGDVEDGRWGTPEKVIVGNSATGVAALLAYGTYSYRVSEPQRFVEKIARQPVGMSRGIKRRFHSILSSAFAKTVTEFVSKRNEPVSYIFGSQSDIEAEVVNKTRGAFADSGITLQEFTLITIRPSELTPEERESMGLGPQASAQTNSRPGESREGEKRMTGARLSRQQRKELTLALGDAYDPGSFDAILDFELDKSLYDLVPSSTDFPTMLRLVIKKAQQEGWLLELVQAAGRGNPGNARLQRFVRQFEATSVRDQ